MVRGIVILLACFLCTACTCRNEQEPATPEENNIVRPAEGTPPDPEPAQKYITASMRVVTLAGEPISGMMPVATLQPNAFDEPIATGPPTDASGKSSIKMPVSQKIAVRAWDPNLLYFPNNFYDVLPGSGEIQDTLVVTMVKSASIEAVLLGPVGAPFQNENAGIMLFHPVHGPWWPAEADSDQQGKVTFYKVPAGSYVIRIKVASGAMLELPETYIAPDETTQLGAVQLQ